MKLVRNPISQESSTFLNLIRLVAAEIVVIGHFLTKYQPVFGEQSFVFGSTMGGTAVLLFFVLSGLLICYSLSNKLDNPEYRFRNFFVDRFSRIYSGLVPAMLFGAIITAAIYFTNYSYYSYLSSMQSAPSLMNFSMTLGMLERFPVNFFSSLFSVFGLSFPLPSVTPFGFNGILWTLVVEWWIYMFFGWLVIGALGLMGKRQRGRVYKVMFFVVAAVLSLLLIGFFEEFSSFIIVWFVGALMMLAIRSETVKSKLSSVSAAKILSILFTVCLVSALFVFYATFAWTRQFYDVFFGLLLSVLVFVGVLFLNGQSAGRVSRLLLNKHIVRSVTVGAGFSYMLFLIHYPIIIFLSGLNIPGDRFLMAVPIVVTTNVSAFCLAYFTERKHKELARTIKHWLHIPQC